MYVAIICASCDSTSENSSNKSGVLSSAATIRDTTQNVFWQELNKLCGQAFAGKVIAGPVNDTVLQEKIWLCMSDHAIKTKYEFHFL